MNEPLVKAVMAAFFKQKQVDAHPTDKGEKGADFYIDGAVVEVKGEGLDYERLFEQLITYAYREREVHLALPVEALTGTSIVQLYVLETVIRELRAKSVRLYLVKEDGDYFYVKEFDSISSLFPHGIDSPTLLIESVEAEAKAR